MAANKSADRNNIMWCKERHIEVLALVADNRNQVGVVERSTAQQRQPESPALNLDFGYLNLLEALNQNQVKIVKVGCGKILKRELFRGLLNQGRLFGPGDNCFTGSGRRKSLAVLALMVDSEGAVMMFDGSDFEAGGAQMGDQGGQQGRLATIAVADKT